MVYKTELFSSGLTDLLLKIIVWRHDLVLFFKEVTNLEPRPFQLDFFREIQDLVSKNTVIVAGRGIGKTLSLAVIALWYILVLSITENHPMKVTILAGSLDQAKICFGYIMDFINNSTFLQNQLAKEPTQREIVFRNGSWIRPLPASEKSVRGYHPDLLIIDEAAQVEAEIIFAALPMTAPSPYARQIFSTTPSTGFSWIEEKWEHQAQFKYPDWKFFNWNAESFLPPDQVEMLKSSMPADKYQSEIQGLPYKREGKVFQLEALKLCQDSSIKRNPEVETYAGVDWGYIAPTCCVIVQRIDENWNVLESQVYEREDSEKVLDNIEKLCTIYNVSIIYTDSTDKGENLRLAARGLPVQPISFKGEKNVMISNLKMLVEQHHLKFNPLTQQALIGQMIDYVYDSKRNDDLVDALLLAVKANPITSTAIFDLEAILKEGIIRKGPKERDNKEGKAKVNKVLREIGRI